MKYLTQSQRLTDVINDNVPWVIYTLYLMPVDFYALPKIKITIKSMALQIGSTAHWD